MVPLLTESRLYARLLAVLASAAALFVLVCHVSWLDEPWDGSLGGVTSGGYYGYAARAFDENGFAATRFRPTLLFHAGAPAISFPYVNHPCTPHFLTYPCYRAFGRDERALRLPILALLVMAVVSLAILARAGGDGTVTAGAVAAFATTPLVIEYGNMVDAPMFSLALLLPGAAAWMAWRRGPRPARYAIFFLFGLLGGLMDWFGYFLVPALWLDLLWSRPKPVRPWRLAFLTGLPFGLALLLYLAWLAWAMGGLAPMWEQVQTLASVPAGLDTPAETVLPPFIPGMARWFRRGLGIPLLTAAAAGLLVALARLARRRATVTDRGALILVIAGLLPAVAFRERALVHEFWILTATPGLALAAAIGVRTAAALAAAISPRAGAVVAAAGIAGLAAWGGWKGVELHDGYRTAEHESRAGSLNEHVGRRDVVFMPVGFGTDRFYIHATMVPTMTKREYFDDALKRLAPFRDEIARLLICWPDYVPADATWLLGLPRKSATQIRYGSGLAALIELDEEACFQLIE